LISRPDPNSIKTRRAKRTRRNRRATTGSKKVLAGLNQTIGASLTMNRVTVTNTRIEINSVEKIGANKACVELTTKANVGLIIKARGGLLQKNTLISQGLVSSTTTRLITPSSKVVARSKRISEATTVATEAKIRFANTLFLL
jgi:hypothetical protein